MQNEGVQTQMRYLPLKLVDFLSINCMDPPSDPSSGGREMSGCGESIDREISPVGTEEVAVSLSESMKEPDTPLLAEHVPVSTLQSAVPDQPPDDQGDCDDVIDDIPPPRSVSPREAIAAPLRTVNPLEVAADTAAISTAIDAASTTGIKPSPSLTDLDDALAKDTLSELIGSPSSRTLQATTDGSYTASSSSIATAEPADSVAKFSRHTSLRRSQRITLAMEKIATLSSKMEERHDADGPTHTVMSPDADAPITLTYDKPNRSLFQSPQKVTTTEDQVWRRVDTPLIPSSKTPKASSTLSSPTALKLSSTSTDHNHPTSPYPPTPQMTHVNAAAATPNKSSIWRKYDLSSSNNHLTSIDRAYYPLEDRSNYDETQQYLMPEMGLGQYQVRMRSKDGKNQTINRPYDVYISHESRDELYNWFNLIKEHCCNEGGGGQGSMKE